MALARTYVRHPAPERDRLVIDRLDMSVWDVAVLFSLDVGSKSPDMAIEAGLVGRSCHTVKVRLSQRYGATRLHK